MFFHEKTSAYTPPPPPQDEPVGKAGKLAQRISHILARLHQGERLEKTQLARQFGVDIRTIERDQGERLAGIIERTADGHWQLAPSSRATIPATHLDEYARMAGVQHVFPDHSLPWLIGQLDTPAEARGLHVQPVPEEDLRAAAPAFDDLQRAVQRRHPCRFSYRGKARHARPYQLIHKNGLWYLAALEEGGKQLKVFRLSSIRDLSVEDTVTFRRQRRHLDYLAGQSDIWFTPRATTVKLHAAAAIARHFQQRALLPKQTTQPNADGSLLISARIHHPTQLLPVVRYWMPHLRILTPHNWQRTLIHELRQTLAAWENDANTPPTKPTRRSEQ